MNFPKIKRAKIFEEYSHDGTHWKISVENDMQWTYKKKFTEERLSRAVWAKTLAKILKDTGGDFKVYSELIKQAGEDEK